MSTLVIKSVPKYLHDFLKKSAQDHRRSQNQEAITILEHFFLGEKKRREITESFFQKRKLLPGYAELQKKGVLKPREKDRDITELISEDRGL